MVSHQAFSSSAIVPQNHIIELISYNDTKDFSKQYKAIIAQKNTHMWKLHENQ